jgi:hypothetical protein
VNSHLIWVERSSFCSLRKEWAYSLLSVGVHITSVEDAPLQFQTMVMWTPIGGYEPIPFGDCKNWNARPRSSGCSQILPIQLIWQGRALVCDEAGGTHLHPENIEESRTNTVAAPSPSSESLCSSTALEATSPYPTMISDRSLRASVRSRWTRNSATQSANPSLERPAQLGIMSRLHPNESRDQLRSTLQIHQRLTRA